MRLEDLTLVALLWISTFAAGQVDISGVAGRTVVGVVDGHVTLPCDVSRTQVTDKLELVLWYRLGSKLPFYTYDARGRAVGRGQHLADDLLSPRARAHFQLSPPGLVLSSLRQLDQGVYICRADFEQSPSRVGVNNLTLIVPSDIPIIYDSEGARLVDVTHSIAPGDKLKLTCEVTGGRPAPRLQWFWNGHPVNSDSEVTAVGVVRNELEITRLSRRDLHSQLVCSASNTNLTAPRTASVRLELLLPPLTVKLARVPTHIRVGNSYEVSCTSRGSRPAAHITWMVGGRRTLAGVRERPSADPNVTVSVLTLVGEVSGAPLQLVCQAANPQLPRATPLRDQRIVPVHYPPQVTLRIGKTLVPSEIKEGNDVYFECLVEAAPPVLEVAWYHKGRQLVTNRRAGIMIHERSLVLPNVSREQTGSYTCGATNAEGSNQSLPVRLNVMYLPRCEHQQQKVFFVPGRPVRLQCRLLSQPSQVRFKWDVNSSSTDHQRVYLSRVSTTGSISILQHRLDREEDAEIRCWGSNSVGLQRHPCVFHLLPAATPEAVRECVVSNSTVTWLEVNCKPGRDGGLPQLFVLEVTEEATQKLVYNLTRDRPVFRVPDLTPGANYSLRVYAASAKGRSGALQLRVGTAVLIPDRIAYSTSQAAGPVAAVLGGVILVLLLLAGGVIVSLRRRVRRPLQLKPPEAEEVGQAHAGRHRDGRSPDLLASDPGVKSYHVSGTQESFIDSPGQMRNNYKYRQKPSPEELYHPSEHIISNPMESYGFFTPESARALRPHLDLDTRPGLRHPCPGDDFSHLPSTSRRPPPHQFDHQSVV